MVDDRNSEKLWNSHCFKGLLCLCLGLWNQLGEMWAQDLSSDIQFENVATEAGIDFLHYSPLTKQKHLHLFMGSGLAWIDIDHDGWCDLYVCQGAAWETQADKHDAAPGQVTDRLYRNQGDGTFVDITEQSGLVNHGYSMGVAVGDFNNDGFSDLYISRFGANQLYQNNGDGTFVDVTEWSQTNNDGYGASCTWADSDHDGLLDLMVVNYVAIDHQNYPICEIKDGEKRVYAGCHPRFLEGENDHLFNNQGDGQFGDISSDSGLRVDQSRQGLGVIALDVDNDQDVDIYVANDSVPNHFWVNDGQGDFLEHGLLSGLAVNRIGLHEAGMGIAAGDYNRDGKCDLFVTNFFKETNTLYRNDELYFSDVTAEVRLATPSRRKLAFGTNFLDADNDGWLDLFVANGHIHNHYHELGRDEPFEQEPQFFSNQQGTDFEEISLISGEYFRLKTLGRGSACADYNHDGFVDLAVSHLNHPLALLKNCSPQHNRSISLKLIGTTSNRDGIGSRITVVTEKGQHHAWKTGSNSYLSCDEGVLHIGIGQASQAERVLVYWPSGRTEHWDNLKALDRHILVEGNGVAQE